MIFLFFVVTMGRPKAAGGMAQWWGAAFREASAIRPMVTGQVRWLSVVMVALLILAR